VVYAFNQVGESDVCEAVIVKTEEARAPEKMAPLELLILKPEQLELEWVEPECNGLKAINYRVEYQVFDGEDVKMEDPNPNPNPNPNPRYSMERM